MTCWSQTYDVLSHTVSAAPVLAWTPAADASNSGSNHHAVTFLAFVVDTGSYVAQTTHRTCSEPIGTPAGHPYNRT